MNMRRERLRWTKHVDINGPIRACEEGDLSWQEAGRQIVSILNREFPETWPPADMTLAAIVGAMEYAIEDGTCEEFDGALDDLYDWADDNGVWLGLQ